MSPSLEPELTPEKPSHYLRVSVTAEGKLISGVRCKIYLPEAHSGKIRLEFFPSPKQIVQLKRVWKFSFQGRLGARKRNGWEIRVACTTAHRSSQLTTGLGTNLAESTIIATPSDLRITEIHGARLGKPTQTHFWLTNNDGLDPIIHSMSSWTGKISVRRKRRFSCNLSTGDRVTTDLHYRYAEETTGLVQRFESVFELKHAKGVSHGFREETLRSLDDLLAIASFGKRQRRVCVGWTVGYTGGVVNHYRRDVTIPPSHTGLDDELVPPQNFQEFVRKSYRRFVGPLGGDLLIRLALYKLAPNKRSTMETDFLKLFGSVETILLHFRNANGLLTVLPEAEWRKARKAFDKNLKAWLGTELEIKADQLTEMRSKLNELNRISMQTVMKKFCEFHSLDLTDLWPLFADGADGPSLSSIRNKFTHGYAIGDSTLSAINAATVNLQFTAERMLLCVLGWPIGLSNVHFGYLRGNWDAFRSELNAWSKS